MMRCCFLAIETTDMKRFMNMVLHLGGSIAKFHSFIGASTISATINYICCSLWMQIIRQNENKNK